MINVIKLTQIYQTRINVKWVCNVWIYFIVIISLIVLQKHPLLYFISFTHKCYSLLLIVLIWKLFINILKSIQTEIILQKYVENYIIDILYLSFSKYVFLLIDKMLLIAVLYNVAHSLSYKTFKPITNLYCINICN